MFLKYLQMFLRTFLSCSYWVYLLWFCPCCSVAYVLYIFVCIISLLNQMGIHFYIFLLVELRYIKIKEMKFYMLWWLIKISLFFFKAVGEISIWSSSFYKTLRSGKLKHLPRVTVLVSGRLCCSVKINWVICMLSVFFSALLRSMQK